MQLKFVHFIILISFPSSRAIILIYYCISVVGELCEEVTYVFSATRKISFVHCLNGMWYIIIKMYIQWLDYIVCRFSLHLLSWWMDTIWWIVLPVWTWTAGLWWRWGKTQTAVFLSLPQLNAYYYNFHMNIQTLKTFLLLRGC